MDLYDQIESTRFLGVEFLSWLWFRVSAGRSVFELDGQPLEVEFDNQMTFETTLAETERTRLMGGAPSESPEALQAMRCGKVVTVAKLRLRREDREYSFVLNARAMSIASAKIPAVLSKQDDDRFYERMDLLSELESSLQGLFGVFLKIRLERWQHELEAMREWVQAS
ncbi:MAG: hypothetical protein RBU37_03270 [Myxococcota bacterium]|jgi:hypothetical protein|nr:hypothetical protein [Myxococcota bacterium]